MFLESFNAFADATTDALNQLPLRTPGNVEGPLITLPQGPDSGRVFTQPWPPSDPNHPYYEQLGKGTNRFEVSNPELIMNTTATPAIAQNQKPAEPSDAFRNIALALAGLALFMR